MKPNNHDYSVIEIIINIRCCWPFHPLEAAVMIDVL